MRTCRPDGVAAGTGPRLSLAVAGTALLAGLSACASGDGEGSASPTVEAAESSSTSASGSPSASAEGPGESSGESPALASPTEATRPTGLAIKTAGSPFGKMLFDRSGQAIYLFEKETGPRAACYGPCAEAWPPVLTKGRPRAVGGARQGLLGTTTRKDGSRQVTYAGHPLYYYAHEDKGEVLCHDVEQFGALWLVVQPNGSPAPH